MYRAFSSNICPQCRCEHPTVHKIYLIQNDSPEPPTAPAEDQEDLKTKLESSIDKLHELQSQLQEGELNFLHLQEQYSIECDIRKRLERQIAETTHSEDNFLQLHAQYSESEDRAKLLQEENERIALENEYKSQELELKSNEISALKESLNDVRNQSSEENQNEILHLHAQYSQTEDRLKVLEQEVKRLTLDNQYKSKEIALKSREISALKEFRNGKCESSDIIVNTKVNMLEQKVDHLKRALEKEIANSTQMQIDKIRLQSQIQRLQLHSNSATGIPDIEERKTQPKRQSMENSTSLTNVPHALRSSSSSLRTDTDDQEDRNSRSIVLQKFPFKEIRYPLEDVIVSVAAKMNVSITKNDIVKVCIMDRIVPRRTPRDVCVQVEFSSNDFKSQFLSQRHLLRNYENFKTVNIKPFVDKQIHGIFLYASRLLRGVVFDEVHCRNNTIIAKNKHQGIDDGVIIHSKEQVDELLKKSTLDTASQPPQVSSEVVDECYYRI